MNKQLLVLGIVPFILFFTPISLYYYAISALQILTFICNSDKIVYRNGETDMKKMITFALVCIFALVFVACGREASDDTAAWREHLAEYEAWVDSYVETMERYNNDPSIDNLLACSDSRSIVT